MTAAAAPDDLRPPAVRSPGHRPLIAVAFGTVVFSTGPVLAVGTDVSGVVFSFWRLWIGAAAMAIAAGVHRLLTGTRTSRLGWGYAAAAGVAFATHQGLFVSAVKAASVVDVTLMNTVAPIAVGLLAVPLFGERPGPSFRLWSAVAMAGAALVAIAGSTGPQADPLGMVLAAGNVGFYVLFFVGSKVARAHIEPVPFLFGAMLAGAVALSGFVAVTGEATLPISREDLLRCLAVALVPGFAGHFSVTWALRWVPANVPPVFMLAIPVLAGAMAWVVLGQPVRPIQIGAGVLTLAGVAGAVWSRPAGDTEATEALALAEEP
jgi:drug/metabolite transporter (DMT)-like permease